VSRPEADSSKGIGRVNIGYRCSGLKLASKSVLVFLAARHHEDRGYAWVSIGEIAHSCSMSPTCVKDNLKVLVTKGLIERQLRDESVKKSRKTIIKWDAVEKLCALYRPKLKVDAPVVTPPAIIAADAAIADTLDTQVKKTDDETLAKKDKYALTDEIITLLKTHFGDHPTFKLPDWRNMMRGCVRACIDKASGGDLCLGVLTQICTQDGYEDLRKSVGKSRMLGGYIKSSFPDWLSDCLVSYGETLDGMCQHSKGCSFPEAQEWVIPAFKEWLTAEVGQYLLGIKDYQDEDKERAVKIMVPETYRAARILSSHTGQTVNPEALPDGEDLNVAEVAVFAINDEKWSKELRDAADAEEYFLDNFKEMRRDYVSQRNEADDDDDDSPDIELPDEDEEDDGDDSFTETE
jgi:hypothetical protein